ncbi:DUF2164 domain-containing protein [Paraglaciecola sp. L3A3]|uniref:DUF2164 domain-containing protein n=1 Tax=Paraglaciecola sp. L3A3 TaxID=2686358 RepID=UPI00131CE0AB|nr:DUF2164 domain-containing protein [Paraglaciecola sp. L3A3]
MSAIEFSPEQKLALVTKLQKYMSNELEVELGQFDAEFLLDFISKEMGNIYYNQALTDAQSVLTDKMDLLTDAIYQLEKY